MRIARSKIRVILTTLILVSCSALSVAQPGEFLSDFRLVMRSGAIIEGHQGFMEDSLFTGRTWMGTRFTADVKQVEALFIPEKRQTWRGAWDGARMGLGTWLLGAMEIERNPNLDWDVHPAVLAIGMVASGALIGSLIGSLFYDWKPLVIASP